jgi:GDP-L-fucose synthase
MELLKGNYLVAGSTGLMGTAALLRLANQEGISVRAVYRKRKPHIFADNISYVQADLTNKEDCQGLVSGIDYVFMFAAILSTAPVIAKNPVSHITSNMIMNSQMLEAAYFADVKKFLWLSSSTGYPLTDTVLKEENMFDDDPPDIHFPVGWMSRYTETLCRMYATKLKKSMPVAVLRPTTIYGEYEGFDFKTCHVFPALIRRVADRQKPIEVWGTGKNSRDLIYYDDVFDACILALVRVEKYDVFNIGYGVQYDINELLDKIIKIDHYDDAKITHDASKPSSIMKRVTDLSKAEKVLGFKAKTTIEQGIEKMLKWYRENYIINDKEA